MGNHTSVSDKHEQLATSYTFEIDNISTKNASPIKSPTFLYGECEWYIAVYPKKKTFDNNLGLYLQLVVENPFSLESIGWSKTANFRFFLLNQSGKVLYSTIEISRFFCASFPAQGVMILPLSRLKQNGFLENDKLIIKVVVKVVKSGYVTGREMCEVETFQVPYFQGRLVRKIFEKHPDIAVDFKPKSQVVKTAYMNVLLGLIQKLRKSPQSLSKTELKNACSEFNELTEAGFKLDWLKKKLEEVALERKNAFSDGSQVEEVEERIKNLELTLSDLKVELQSEKAKSAAAAAKLLSLDDIL